MNPSRRQRGSAYLYVIVCLVVMGILTVELVPYIAQVRNTQARRADKIKADLAGESLAQQIMAEAKVTPFTVGASRSLSLNGVTVTAALTDGFATTANSLLATGTATVASTGNVYQLKRPLTKGILSTPFNFAVFSATDLTYTGPLATGASGADGDVALNGKLTLPNSSTAINGDASATGNITIPQGTVSGTRRSGIFAVTFPTATASNYYSSASVVYGTTTTNGGVPLPTVVAPYIVVYINGDLTISGSITNRGCIYVAGNMTVSGNMNYSNATSEVSFIVQGNLTFGSGCSQASGFFYAQGQIVNQSSSLTIPRGVLVANAFSNASGTLSVTRDNFVRNTPTEGTNLYLPGYWP